MKHLPAALSLAAALCVSALDTAPVFAQTPQFTDPANLRGERVTPRDGRELPIDGGNGNAALGLAQLLRRLNTRASVMNIVAHPDDEDGGMLTLYSRGLGARVADLSLTRGEGGQNAMTADFEDALGLLRTQELLAADRYTGVDQFFGTEVDFGFSKTKEEAFAKWTHDRVLYDVVRAVRIYRPLVLTSTWIGGVTDGHGQHQAAGQIAQEAFLAAGDPKVFPELTVEGILPWQPLRIYARVPRQSITPQGLYDYATNQYTPARFTNYVTGEVTTTPPTPDILVHEGTPDPLLDGKTYIQFARLGLAQQRSQIGPDFHPAPSGAFDVPYHLYGSKLPTTDNQPESSDNRVPQGFSLGSHALRKDVGFSPQGMPSPDSDPNFFTGIDTSLESIATLAPHAPTFLSYQLARIANEIRTATSTYDPQDVTKVASPLKDALQTCDTLIGLMASTVIDYPEKANILQELRIKRVQINDALALSLGVSLTATAHNAGDTEAPMPQDPLLPVHEANILPGEKFLIHTQLNRPKTPGLRETTSELSLNGKVILCDPCAEKPDDILVRPAVRQQVILLPNNTPVTRPYFSRDTIEDAVYTHLDPALRNAPSTPAPLIASRLLDYDGTPFTVSAVIEGNLTADTTHAQQPLSIVPPLSVALSTHAQVLPSDQHSFFLNLSLTPPRKDISAVKIHTPLTWKALPAATTANCFGCYPFNIEVPLAVRKPASIDASAKLDGHTYDESYRAIGYGDLPRTNFFTPAETRIVPVDLKLPIRHHIAYLPGTGDAVPQALASIGLTPTLLKVSDLTAANLAQYDTVILGVRTYAAHPDLHGAPTQALLDYARQGGNVVVQYQTSDFTAADAPYPLSLGSKETVVDETAPVRLIDDKSSYAERLLVVPNRITSADFSGWVAERGHGFLATWDPHYTAPTETHDPGQDPQRGGLITTPLGSGRWTYLAFALYRQLPEAVPGAFRLFLNLLTP